MAKTNADLTAELKAAQEANAELTEKVKTTEAELKATQEANAELTKKIEKLTPKPAPKAKRPEKEPKDWNEAVKAVGYRQARIWYSHLFDNHMRKGN